MNNSPTNPVWRFRSIAGKFRVWLAFLAAGFTSTGVGADRRVLPSRVPPAVLATNYTALSRTPGGTVLSLSIGLTPRNTNELALLIENLYTPSHPLFRRYLTPAEFTKRFGPTVDGYEAVMAYARANHLEVTGVHPNRLVLDVRGAVADIERAFQVRMVTYARPGGGVFHAPDAEPSVDARLPIETVSGLSDLLSPLAKVRSAPGGMSGSGPGGGLMAADLRRAYLQGVAQTGAGQSVALVEFDGFFTNDIALYERANGLPAVPLKPVLLNGYDGTPGAANFEVALDIEAVIAMAPGLDSLVIYEAQPYNAANSLLNRIATDSAARQISSSWVIFTDATTERIFQQFAAQGQSFSSSVSDLDSLPSPIASATFGVSSGVPPPCDDPYITLVGGTTLSVGGAGGGWLDEVVWNQGFAYPHYWGTGGGVSPTRALPSWQKGAANAANGGSTTRRNAPDLAMVADNVWFAFNNGVTGALVGTSISSPLWAGYVALANELAQSLGRPPVGFVNPALYQLGAGPTYPALFHDITNGNNATPFSANKYPAVPGYDLCTGWGTPKGADLLYALAVPPTLVVSPGAETVMAGPGGGPFTPAAQTFSLTNAGVAPLQWTLTGLAAWLDASATNGTLAPGDPAALITVSLNAAAGQLAAGSTQAALVFTDTVAGIAQSRTVTLLAGVPPAVSVTPPSLQVIAGAGATLVASAVGNPPFTFQWWRGATNLVGAGPSLTLTNVGDADAGFYTVTVSNAFGAAVSVGTPLVVTPAAAPGVSFETLYSFTGGADGATPMELAAGPDGNYYGATFAGGRNKLGSIYRVTPTGVVTSLHSFGTAGLPLAGLTPTPTANFLGVSYADGANGFGTVFSVTTNGAVNVRYNFPGGGDGAFPTAALTLAADGMYYGTTTAGGDPTLGAGMIYRITANGRRSAVHVLGKGEGASPLSRLTAGRDGYLYGVTTSGGAAPNDGTLFRLSTNGVFTTLAAWHGTNGFQPAGPLCEGDNGDFYGLANNGVSGPGFVYRLSPDGRITVLHAFGGLDDGQLGGFREGALLRAADGNFYGTTGAADASGAMGTVFRLTPDGQLSTLARFQGANGANPGGSLVAGPDGYLYGTTFNGGTFGYGVIFRLGVFPRLRLTATPAGPALVWPSWAAGFVLQQSSDLTGDVWSDVATPPEVAPDGEFMVTLPPAAGSRFFRLAMN